MVDTLLSIMIASMVMYIMQFRLTTYRVIQSVLKRFFEDKYCISYQARIFTRRHNENFSESFIAIKGWIVDGIKNNEFENAYSLSEIQLPRSLSAIMGTILPEKHQTNEEDCEHTASFNRSIMILDQMDKIIHKKINR